MVATGYFFLKNNNQVTRQWSDRIEKDMYSFSLYI